MEHLAAALHALANRMTGTRQAALLTLLWVAIWRVRGRCQAAEGEIEGRARSASWVQLPAPFPVQGSPSGKGKRKGVPPRQGKPEGGVSPRAGGRSRGVACVIGSRQHAKPPSGPRPGGQESTHRNVRRARQARIHAGCRVSASSRMAWPFAGSSRRRQQGTCRPPSAPMPPRRRRQLVSLRATQ